MSLMSNILLFFVILGAVNIIILLIIKSKAKSMKSKESTKTKIHDIRVLNYDDEDLICMVDNNLELEYGYGCSDKAVYENMKKSHRNIYTLLWFETEMENGGLGEYLFNLSNITMDYIVEAFKDIGAFDLLEKYNQFIKENNIEEAISQINKRNVEEYSIFMSQFDFSKFDSLYKTIDLRSLMANYIRKNIMDFSDLNEKELKILKEIEEENVINNN